MKKKILYLIILISLALLNSRTVVAEDIAYTGLLSTVSTNYVQYHTSYKNFQPIIPMVFASTASFYDQRIKDIETIRSYGENINEFAVSFSSITDLKNKITNEEANRLKNLGVTTLMYNIEKELTPEDQWNNRFNTDATNPIVQFGEYVESLGFRAIWTPIRIELDNSSDQLITLIYQSGIDGIGIQEQKFIEKDCAATRIKAVEETIARHKRLSGKNIFIIIQTMSSRCLDAIGSCPTNGVERCNEFIDGLIGKVNIISVWPTGDETTYFNVIRRGGLTSPTPTPDACPELSDSLPSSTYQLDLAEEGDFKPWFRMMGTDTEKDSFYLRVDNQCPVAIGDGLNEYNKWLWINHQSSDSGLTYHLSQGNHTITLIKKDSGVKIDRIIFTKRLNCVPESMGENCINVTVSPSTIPTLAPTQTIIPTQIPIPTNTPTITPTPTIKLTATPTPIKDKINPKITIISPTNGQVFLPNSTVTITATAIDNSEGSGIARVEFYVNNKLNCTVIGNIVSYQCRFTTTKYGSAYYTIRATAYDKDNNRSSDIVVLRLRKNFYWSIFN